MALFSTPQTTQQLPVGFSPQQTSAMNQLLSSSLGRIESLLGPQANSFQPIAQQARQQFQTQTIPSIAERFTSMGAGAQRSSAFPQILGQAGADLESSIAALESQAGMQQRGMDLSVLQNLLGIGLTPQTQTQIMPSQRGELSQFGGQIGSSILSLLPLLIGGLFGGPSGAALGGGLSALSR